MVNGEIKKFDVEGLMINFQTIINKGKIDFLGDGNKIKMPLDKLRGLFKKAKEEQDNLDNHSYCHCCGKPNENSRIARC